MTPQRRWGLQKTRALHATESSAYRDQIMQLSPRASKTLGHGLWSFPSSSENKMVQHPQSNTSPPPLSLSALQPLQRAEPQPPLLCPTSQAPATHRRVEKMPLSPAVPRNHLHEDRTVLTAHSSLKKGASSWWGDFLLSSHWQRQSIPGQRLKDKAAL